MDISTLWLYSSLKLTWHTLPSSTGHGGVSSWCIYYTVGSAEKIPKKYHHYWKRPKT